MIPSDLEYCIQVLSRIIKRERLQKLFVAFFTLAGALVLGGIAAQLTEASASSFTGVLAIGTFLVGFLFLLQILHSWQVAAHPLVQILQTQPEQIVWVYAIHVQLMPVGIKLWDTHTFSIHLSNKKEIQLTLKSKQIALLRSLLQRLLPHATFGYSHERAQWYTANPLLLYNSPKDKKQ